MSTGTTLLDTSSSTDAGWSRSIISIWVLLGGGLVMLAHAPVVWTYCASLVSLPQYEFIYALPVFAGILIYTRARELGQLSRGGSWESFVLFGVAACLLTIAGVIDSPWLGAISALWALLAVIFSLGGDKLVFAALPAWCMLWLAIRLPMRLDDTLVQFLQEVAASKASVFLHFMGQPHILDGNVVETPVKRYLVEEACSGVQSLFAITACTLFYIFWSRMSWWRAIIILTSAWAWVWVANVTRVILVTYLNSNWDIPIDKGAWHDAFGVALFAGTLGLIVSTGHLMWFFLPYGIFGKRDGLDTAVLSPNAHNTEITATRFPSLRQTTVAAPWLVMLYVAVNVVLWLPQLRVPAATATATQLNMLGENIAPKEFRTWKLIPGSHQVEQRASDSQWGAHSQSWRYQSGDRQMVVSIDYPFLGWHELSTCYAGAGWTIGDNNREVVRFSDLTEGAKQRSEIDRCVVLKMRRPVQNDYGMIVFQCFNDRREPMPIPEDNLLKLLMNRLKSYRQRLTTMGADGSDLHSQARTFQLQVFLQDDGPLTEQDEGDVRQLFARFRIGLQTALPEALGEHQVE